MGTPQPLSVSPSELQLIRALLEYEFPNLAYETFNPESEDTDDYNCIAWAAEDVNQPWWPTPDPQDAYWPIAWRAVERDCFVEAFRQDGGYEPCGQNFDLEQGYEKVALYLAADDTPTHMARQLPSGVWTSKLGRAWDITHHTLRGVEGQYGRAVLALRRPVRS